MKQKPSAAPAKVKSAPAPILNPKPARVAKLRDQLRLALADPDMRQQMVRVIRQFMAEEK